MLPDYRLVDTLLLTERHGLYSATRVSTGTPVILKRALGDYPLPEDVLRLEFESHLLERLRGPGVIELLATERASGSPVLVLEDFGARSLAAFPTPLPLQDFFPIAERCVEALGRVHAADVVHKDIKPSNILCNAATGVVKLIDFQLAAEASREHDDRTSTKEVHGSLPYLSPEQTGRMNRALDYRSDYYSLGITFFQLLTGRLPFSASDMMGWVHCHVSKQPPLASEVDQRVPAVLARLVAKLMNKEPSQRYQSAHGLIVDLRRAREAIDAGRGDDTLELGTEDTSERFSVSRRVVGRTAELDAMLRAFERASTGPARLLAIGGYAGIGKSSLIGELHRPITGKGGCFASGKFDQLDRSVPYAALLEALRDYLHQLLAESEERIEACRERIVAEVGQGLPLITEVLPELTQLVGPQRPPEQVDTRAAQSRFRNAFARFVRALARADAPLVLCLDDMQWTDASTPELLVEVVVRGEAKHLLIVVAYRDNEVLAGHLLAPALGEVRELAPLQLDELTLQPLSAQALGELIATSLRTTPERCASLSAVVAEKTQGNPFFAGELLMTLHRQGALRLDARRVEWTWDMAAVRAAKATANVVELMAHRIGTLPTPSIAALRLAACLGSTFNLSAVATLLGTDRPSVAEALIAPTREGAIVPLDEDYRFVRWAAQAGTELDARFRFQHDRVQEAAYALIPESERPATHLRIGRLLMQQDGVRRTPGDLFAACNHLNQGRTLLLDFAEREQVMLLNRQAADKASKATAFAVAVRYLDAAANVLSPAEWEERPAQRFELMAARVSSVLMAGELARASLLCDELFGLALNDVQRGQVHLLKCNVSLYQANLAAAVEAVRQGLRLFGIVLPSDPEAIGAGIGAGIARMQEHLARVSVDRLPELPTLEDPGLSVAMQLLFNVVPAAVMISPPLFVLAELLMFDTTLTHGLTDVSAKNFVDCGMIQGQFLSDYATAYRLGKAAFRVLDRFGARTLGTSVHFVFAAFVSGWGAPLEEALASCQIGKKLSIESGDTLHLAYHNVLYPRLLLLMGRALPECLAECREAMALVTRLGATVQTLGVRLCLRAVERLTDVTASAEEASLADEALEGDIVASGSHPWAFQGGEVQLLVSVLLGEWERAERWSAMARAHEQAGSTFLAVPEFHLLECLLTARQRWPQASDEERTELLAECRGRRDKLQRWALECAENFEAMFVLASAEIARLVGEAMDSVLALYERAASCAGQRFIHLHALALEFESEYLRDQGCDSLADGVLERAVGLYARWGAAVKVKRLARRRLRLFSGAGDGARGSSVAWSLPAGSRAPAASTVSATNLDVDSVLKATQVISSEVRTDHLYALLMQTMAENAGAEDGCLVLPHESSGAGLVYAHTGTIRGEGNLPAPPSEQSHRVCLAVLRYVTRTQHELIIDDASAHPRFSREPYVAAHGVKSVLCLPVVHQRVLRAILYLENNVTTHAFTADRVRALRVLAGQAAISIANAQLYATLEQRVEERTRALSAKTRKVEAMLNGIHQGLFTIDANLTVQPEYSQRLPHLLGKSEIVGRHVDELLFAGSRLSAEERSRNQGALMFAFGAPASVAAYNAAHLITEFSRPSAQGSDQIFELDWNWIVGETQLVESVLVTLRDVTEVRRLAQSIAQAERESTLITRILDIGLGKFLAFCTQTHSRLKEAENQLTRWASATTSGHDPRGHNPISPNSLSPSSAGASSASALAVFRALHTIKGNAGSLGLEAIVRAAHDAEDRCRSSEDGQILNNPEAALDALRALERLVTEQEALARRKLGPAAAEGWECQAVADIEARLGRAPESALTSDLRAIIANMRAVPLRRLFEEAAQHLPTLARELGKAAPHLDCEDTGLRLAAQWAPVLTDSLVHVLRNAIDHGIESPAERLAAGKPEQGQISVRVEQAGECVHLRIGDDGRGLALEQLRQKSDGSPCSDEELGELMFAFGLSTASQVSTVSGRGIGMDAVRGELRRHGGDAWAEFTGPAQSGYRPFALVLSMPQSAALAGSGAPPGPRRASTPP